MSEPESTLGEGLAPTSEGSASECSTGDHRDRGFGQGDKGNHRCRQRSSSRVYGFGKVEHGPGLLERWPGVHRDDNPLRQLSRSCCTKRTVVPEDYDRGWATPAGNRVANRLEYAPYQRQDVGSRPNPAISRAEISDYGDKNFTLEAKLKCGDTSLLS